MKYMTTFTLNTGSDDTRDEYDANKILLKFNISLPRHILYVDRQITVIAV